MGISRNRRLVGLLGAVIATAAISTHAHAALIGVDSFFGRPDISYNGAGLLTYDATTDAFSVTANATQITLPGGSIETISATFPNLSLGLFVDATGAFTGGIAGSDLTITGTSTSFTSPLVTAEVIGFGFATSGSGTVWEAFDALLTVTGGSVYALGTTIGMTMIVEGASFPVGGIDFTSNFCYGADTPDVCPGTTVKGDVAPVPEPATLLLLGSGLVGMGWFGRKRLKKDEPEA